MYTVAGITFYDESDSDQDIAKEYKECLIDTIMSINEDTSREELEDNETVIANAESIVHQYKASSVYTVNRRLSEEVVRTHEQHWLEFFGSYGFKSKIIHIDTTPMLRHLASIGFNRIDNLWIGLSNLNDNRFLYVDIYSEIMNDRGENLRLSKNFIQSMQSMIPSFVSSDGEKLMIQYGPYSDINLALSLTRLLHLLL